jgi:hypothetical protein
MRELVIEYQLLRRVMNEQISEELNGELDVPSNVALNMAGMQYCKAEQDPLAILLPTCVV